MPENVTLPKLSVILQTAMGWHGGHLHEYVVGRLHYGIPDEDWPDQEPVVDERCVRLNTLVETGARRFNFLYDFGDAWEHTIKIEDLVVPDRGSSALPEKTHAHRKTSAGYTPYFDFLAAIGDPAHEEHRMMLEWIGGSFDPVAFSIADTNERLSTIKI